MYHAFVIQYYKMPIYRFGVPVIPTQVGTRIQNKGMFIFLMNCNIQPSLFSTPNCCLRSNDAQSLSNIMQLCIMRSSSNIATDFYIILQDATILFWCSRHSHAGGNLVMFI